MKLNFPTPTKLMPGLAILISIVLLSGCTLALTNHPPIISALTAEKDVISPSEHCEITCVASDPDGDSLTYQWTINGGNITGEGSMVTWIAPDTEGIYSIAVTVSDGNKGKDVSLLTIQVIATNHQPTIEDLIITPKDTKVYEGKTCDIECLASDPDGDELSYEWSASGGSISGESSKIVWTAPNTTGTYTIAVVVTDGKGGEVSASLDINVVAVNNPPVIQGLVVKNSVGVVAKEGKVLKNNRYYVECTARDPDGDELSYKWSVSEGYIKGKGSVATWTTPGYRTEVTVTVMVSDGKGGEAIEKAVFKTVWTICEL